MAFIYISVAFVAVAISISMGFPVENSSNSQNSDSVFKVEKDISVVDKVVGNENSPSNVLTQSVVHVNSVVDKHVIVKRRAGIMGTRKCARDYFRTSQGCLPCHGRISDECTNKDDAIDYSEVYNYVDDDDED